MKPDLAMPAWRHLGTLPFRAIVTPRPHYAGVRKLYHRTIAHLQLSTWPSFSMSPVPLSPCPPTPDTIPMP